MNTIPTLSIITINRNNAQGLEKTIENVVTQTGFSQNKLEYIIIDGASTDDSVKVIQKFIQHPDYGSKITYWVSEPDTGIYNAMNKGIKKARGSLIGIINSGDWYLPHIFSDIITTHESNPNSILYGALKAYSKNGFESIWGKNAKILPKEMIPHPPTFVPKKCYEQYGYFNESYKIAGDYELFLRFYTNKVDFQFIDKIICCYNLEGISQTSKKTDKEVINVKKQYGFYTPPTFKQNIKTIIKKILRW